ncbi:MAG: ParB/RepB/Spo0J family partition protein [Clostridia bacterium]|nr:ParB/RepB/Spo0J family partition protein [Clostridia bacterium]
MDTYATYYPPQTPGQARINNQMPAESMIYLPAAQIIAQRTEKIPKNEQNHIIRLAASIKKYGILEPLAVKAAGNSPGFPTYELVDGERRFRAAAIAGVERLPCTVLPANAQKCATHAFICRLKQENLHFFDLSEAFHALFHDYRITQEEIARKMGLSQSAVANKLRLLRLPPEERVLIRQAGLSERHARALLRLESPKKRKEALALLLSAAHTVAEAERLIDSFLPKKQEKTTVLPDFTAVFTPNEPAPPAKSREATPAEEAAPAAEQHAIATAEQGITPKKFILRDLQPLYHSIERTIGIFKKTGATVNYVKEEDEHRALITISIPKKP